MTLTLTLSPETERKLAACAARVGKTAAELAQQLIEEALGSSGVPETAQVGLTLDEILAPVRQEFERSGMTDDDLAALCEELRQKVWQEKQTRQLS